MQLSLHTISHGQFQTAIKVAHLLNPEWQRHFFRVSLTECSGVRDLDMLLMEEYLKIDALEAITIVFNSKAEFKSDRIASNSRQIFGWFIIFYTTEREEP